MSCFQRIPTDVITIPQRHGQTTLASRGKCRRISVKKMIRLWWNLWHIESESDSDSDKNDLFLNSRWLTAGKHRFGLNSSTGCLIFAKNYWCKIRELW